MDIDFIERLIGLVERSRVTELDYAEGNTTVRISRDAGIATAHEGLADPRPHQTSPAKPAEASAGVTGHVIAAGMIGTFFRSQGPGQPPFVSEDETVEEGQTLGILEAMKMLNPVEADRAGRILRILVEDGVPVEAGTPLFAITPLG